MRSRSTEIAKEACSKYYRIISDARCAEFLSRFPLNRFWANENMVAMRAIMDNAQTAEEIVHGAHRTFMFSVNSFLPEKENAVTWLLGEQARRGIDLFLLPKEIEESHWSLPDNNVERNGRRLTPDFLRTVNIALRIRECITAHIKGPANILELGAGLGHLARTLRLFGLSKRHVIVDIPETLVFSYCFLALNFPEAKCVIAGDAHTLEMALSSETDFVFVPSFLAELTAGGHHDLFINTASMGEMTNATIRYWMSWLQERINPHFVFTLNRYLNTINPRFHGWRWDENEASVHYDAKWEIMNWQLEPSFTRSPYLDPTIARYVEIIARRQPLADTEHSRRRSQQLLDDVAKQDWYRFRNADPIMTMRDNVLASDLAMSGTLFALWDSLRLSHTARGAGMMLRYLQTLLWQDGKEFEEMHYYHDLFFSLYRGEEDLADEACWVRSCQTAVVADPKLIAEGPVYNIVQIGERYVAASKALGPVNIMQDRLGDREIGDFVLIADSLDQIEQRIDQLGRDQPKLVSVGSEYNIVQIGERYVAASKALGQINIMQDRLGDREIGDFVLIADSLEQIEQRIAQRRCDQPKLISVGTEYNIVQIGERYVGVSRALGQVNLMQDRLGDREIGNSILIADSLDQLELRIAQRGHIGEPERPKLLSEGPEYNVVQIGGRYIAVSRALGPVDLMQEGLGDREMGDSILITGNLEQLKQRIAQCGAYRRHSRLLNWLASFRKA